MDERRDVRVSDSDREAAAERLGSAVTEGRLDLQEYDDRLGRAYQSVTYGDLADLFVDLPASAPGAVTTTTEAPHRAPHAVTDSSTAEATLPKWLRVIWTIWAIKVAINLTVWVLVSLSDGTPVYFWPMWVIGPPAAALLGLTGVVTLARRSR
ncbi:DUF1707 domain-containing protein [Sphaerisporangium sp. NPDC088356]|uniref:DUF1707 SHOCT-like domain-containing protein n=1 Tax=Sphaerisporangium sp. NPDC088356 TaxID=3154871 RepID=UPI0034336445